MIRDVTPSVTSFLKLLDFLLLCQAREERCALVTITDVHGGSARAAGSHMAVSEAGDYVGSLSGGCVEAAVVGEARRVIAAECAEIVRIGAGSPYFDIRLPCGGGLDILIIPNPSRCALELLQSLLKRRRSAELVLGRNGLMVAAEALSDGLTGWDGDRFRIRHDPVLKLFVIGQGEETRALAQQATAFGATVIVMTPDADIAAWCATQTIEAHVLKSAGPSEHLRLDHYCAVVTLFHDHDWELPYLAQAVRQDALFVGAMGSPGTQARRIEALAEMGVERSALDRIVGPVGLIPATRDPATLALSTLAQVVSVYHAARARTLVPVERRHFVEAMVDTYDASLEKVRHVQRS